MTPQEEFLNDPFLGPDVCLDTSGMSRDTIAKMNSKLGREPRRQDDGFGLRPEVIRSPTEEYAAMMRDPEVRKELAERDPGFAEKYEESEREKVVAEFRHRNPDYLKTSRNASTVIQSLAKKVLGKDWLDIEEAQHELWLAGKFTVPGLTAEFKKCLRAGLLDVPRGTAKELSEADELEVIAKIRVGDTSGAIIRYVELAFSGRLPEYKSAESFLRRQPELASSAALFVWANNQPSLDLEDFKRFQNEKLSGVRLLTYHLIDGAWAEWKKENRRSHLFPNGMNPAPPAREDLDDLSTEEINDRYTQAVRQFRRDRNL